jgi:hypothetical protein
MAVRRMWLTAAAILFLLAGLAGTAARAGAAASVVISINPSVLNWTVSDFINQFLPADHTIVVTGTLVTGAAAGLHTSTVGISSPAKITGTNAANSVPISALTVTCSGNGNSVAPVYAAAHSALVASATTQCATWTTASATTITLNFTINMFLDDRSFPADTYNNAVGFTVVGSAV